MARPLYVVFTGTTVPNVLAQYGDFDAHFRAAIGEAWPGDWATVDARNTALPLPPPGTFAGVLVTGSASSVTERTPWMLRLESWLREIVAAEAPVLGVCFGHQILASALGGEVRKNANGRRIGSLRVRALDADPLLDGLPPSFDVNLSHQDHVAVPPRNVRPLITADHDPLHAFAHGPKARAVQFHPEFHADIVKGYLSARRDLLRAEGMDPDALTARVVDTPLARQVLKNFVKHFARP